MGRNFKEYVQSFEWAQVKESLYESRGRKCEICSSTRNVYVQHLTFERIFNEEPEDLILMCKNCCDKEKRLKEKQKNKNKYYKKK